ncbi:unnamed protein product [Lymnaea stagnalis]|uniref:Uncharacterized protein n=1 Tax=Lymnaea stagnalis TaxID=6523 RepID=A0AAV2I0E5_LYMST
MEEDKLTFTEKRALVKAIQKDDFTSLYDVLQRSKSPKMAINFITSFIESEREIDFYNWFWVSTFNFQEREINSLRKTDSPSSEPSWMQRFDSSFLNLLERWGNLSDVNENKNEILLVILDKKEPVTPLSNLQTFSDSGISIILEKLLTKENTDDLKKIIQEGVKLDKIVEVIEESDDDVFDDLLICKYTKLIF